MAVGIFDSGLGGLTVLEAAQKRLPDVDFIYLADSEHAPYGVRTADDIYELTCAAVQRLFDAGCDLVILACNTASAAALRRMQEGWIPEGKRVLGVFVPLIEALTDARILHSGGDRHETATIEWSVPRFFRHWPRGFDWLQKDRERREAAEQLQIDLAAWKNADRSAVLLMHGTASLKLANELLEHDRHRPFLSDDLRDYFEQSIATDLRLRPPGKKPGAAANRSIGDSTLPPTVADLFKGLRGLFRR